MTYPFSAAIPVRTGVERATLVRRTYALVFLGILVTMAGVSFTFRQPSLMMAVIQHPIIAILCTFAPLMLVMRAPRVFPQNVLLTGLFTFAEGVFLAPYLGWAEQHAPGTVGQAALLTMSTFGVLTLYATVSRRDFSAWGSFFTIGLWVLIAASLLNLFFHSAGASLWLAAGTIFVFGGLLVFDTWRIVRSGAYGEDDYVPAAVMIYLDLLNLFLAILRLLNSRRD